MTALRLFAPLAAVLALSACAAETPTTAAAPAPAPARQCFFVGDVNSFSTVDDSTVNLRIGVRDIYQVKLFAPCHEARMALSMALRSTGGGTSRICDPLDAELVFGSPIGPQRCQLNDIRKLTPAEVAAMNPRFKP